MQRRWVATGLVGLLILPNVAFGADSVQLDCPLWSGLPFVLMLLGIALLPLCAHRFWERNRNKALFAAVLSAPVAIYLLSSGPVLGAPGGGDFLRQLWESSPGPLNSLLGRAGTHLLLHTMGEYLSFIILLASLYTVSGGIVLTGDIQARPLTNTAVLAFGALLANVIGTTGASMLLIRPLLQINQERQHTRHLPVFFIFVVSNLGGLLLPLGDPPLFLGFLQGVRFTWTLSLWPQWLVANGDRVDRLLRLGHVGLPPRVAGGDSRRRDAYRADASAGLGQRVVSCRDSRRRCISIGRIVGHLRCR